MDTIITITGADKAGSLARILSFLAHKGYGVKGQQVIELPSGSRLLKFRLSLPQLDKERLAAEIKTLNPRYELAKIAFEGPGVVEQRAKAEERSAAAFIGEMATRFPDIVPLVRSYAGAFDLGTRGRALFDAGRRLGGVYRRNNGVHGSPSGAPAAPRRALVAALEGFGAVEARDTQIALPESPFCNEINCCEFLTGFMQGFLEVGRLGTNTRVQKTACKASGATHCVYTLGY